jgi:hypothetical protein
MNGTLKTKTLPFKSLFGLLCLNSSSPLLVNRHDTMTRALRSTGDAPWIFEMLTALSRKLLVCIRFEFPVFSLQLVLHPFTLLHRCEH